MDRAAERKQLQELQDEAQAIRVSASMIRLRLREDFRKATPHDLDVLSNKLERWREERLREIERQIRELKEDLDLDLEMEPEPERKRPPTPMPIATKVLGEHDMQLPAAIRQLVAQDKERLKRTRAPSPEGEPRCRDVDPLNPRREEEQEHCDSS